MHKDIYTQLEFEEGNTPDGPPGHWVASILILIVTVFVLESTIQYDSVAISSMMVFNSVYIGFGVVNWYDKRKYGRTIMGESANPKQKTI